VNTHADVLGIRRVNPQLPILLSCLMLNGSASQGIQLDSSTFYEILISKGYRLV